MSQGKYHRIHPIARGVIDYPSTTFRFVHKSANGDRFLGGGGPFRRFVVV